jgi:UDP-GlcNAc:undecaprenyl-phosphate GlcNAc-1-phosphate transferase
LSYAITPAAKSLSLCMGAMDKPDGYRKVNATPMPRLGGLGFFLASMLVLFPLIKESPTVCALLAGGAVLMTGGVADDTYGLSPTAKLLIQCAAALVALAFVGIPEYLSFFGMITIKLSGFAGAVVAFFRMVFTVNAVNFSDGLDGLASGISAVALLSLSVYGAWWGNPVPSLAALVLGSAVLGFLPYNRYHAKIFMGDSGSQFLGLAIAILSLGNAPGGSFTFETSLFLAVPAADTFFSVIRRLIKGKSPFVADKGHLHHVLLKFGVSHPLAVNLLVASSALIALFTLLAAL